MAGQGISGFDHSAWERLCQRMSAGIERRLAAGFGRNAGMPDVIDGFREDGTVLAGSAPRTFAGTG